MAARSWILGAISLLAGALLAVPGASAQSTCKGGKGCCQKEKSGGICIRIYNDYGGVPEEELNGRVTTAGNLRYVLKKDKSQESGFTFGIATADNKITVKPVCEGSLPLVRQDYVACRSGTTLTLYHETGRKVVEVANALPFDEGVFAPGKYITYHGDILVARQQTAEGPRYVLIDQATGRTTVAPEGAVLLGWVRYSDAEDAATKLYYKFSKVTAWETAHVLGVPTGETVQLGPGLGIQPIYRPLLDSGEPMPLPEGVAGVLNVDGYVRQFGYAVALDTPSGRRYALAARGAVDAINRHASLASYRMLDRSVKAAPNGSKYHLTAERDDGVWVVADFWRSEDIISEGGSSGEEAFAMMLEGRIQAQNEQWAAARAAREQAEAAEKARVAALVASAEKCHAVLVAASREGRWAQVPQASRYYGLRNEGWYRAGLGVGDPGVCNDLYRPEYTATFADSDLLKIAPATDILAASAEEPNPSAKLTMLEALDKRGETLGLIEQGKTYYSARRFDDAWTVFAKAANSGIGAGFYWIGRMELDASPTATAPKGQYGDAMRDSVPEMEEDIRYYYYVISLYDEAKRLGYPAQDAISALYTKISGLEKRIQTVTRNAYYADRAQLWRECKRGATVGYEFTCYTDAQGRRVSPYTGRPY
ncbi:MAG: hypothetical protein R3C04_06985 [Hyphomonas sp.]